MRFSMITGLVLLLAGLIQAQFGCTIAFGLFDTSTRRLSLLVTEGSTRVCDVNLIIPTRLRNWYLNCQESIIWIDRDITTLIQIKGGIVWRHTLGVDEYRDIFGKIVRLEVYASFFGCGFKKRRVLPGGTPEENFTVDIPEPTGTVGIAPGETLILGTHTDEGKWEVIPEEVAMAMLENGELDNDNIAREDLKKLIHYDN